MNQMTSIAQCMQDVEPNNEINNEDDHQFIKAIASWAIMFNICHVALAALLAILRNICFRKILGHCLKLQGI